MEIKKLHFLRGPNIWSHRPVLEAWVELGPSSDAASNAVEGFVDRLMDWIPSLIEHRCSVGERGGFLSRLRDGTYPAHILEHVTLELQTLAGTPVGYGRARETSTPGLYKVVVRYVDEEVARRAIGVARDLLTECYAGRPFDVAGAVTELKAVVQDRCLRPSTRAILDAAKARGIPSLRLSSGSLVQLGYGVRQRRIATAETDRTGAVAESIAQDKELTKSLLRAVGIPVPDGEPVESAERAREVAEEIGFPVVLKPREGKHGRAVFTNLLSEAHLSKAYEAARTEGPDILVERLVPGDEHRLLVVGGKLVAAARIVRDGDAGKVSIDVTDEVHPRVAAHAILAAKVVGLDIAGIDVVAESIARPLEEQDGAIIAVDSGPGLHIHLSPARGVPRPVGEAILDTLFAPGDEARVPIVCVSECCGKAHVLRLLTELLRSRFSALGVASSLGLTVGGRLLEKGDAARHDSVRRLLVNPAVDGAIVEISDRSLLTEGLAFDRCDVAVVTGIDAKQRLPRFSIETPDQLFQLKRCGVDVVRSSGVAVLKGDDELTAQMAPLCAGKVIFYALDADHPTLAAHRAAGGLTAHTRDGVLCLAAEGEEVALGNVEELTQTQIPCACRETHTERLLAAAAAAFAMGLTHDAIRAGLAAQV